MNNIKQLSEDLFKLSPEQENAFNAEWVEKIKDYLKTKSPIIRLRVDNSRSYVGGSITLKTHLVDAVVVEGDEFKAYELKELEGTGVYVNYVLQCTTPQINNVVRMLNNIKKEIK